MDKPLVNKTFLLEKAPGKGGWTYAIIPDIAQDKKAPFGCVKVRGFIDAFEIKAYNLMPMGKGKLFLPVKAAIRKKIGKQAGDQVNVTLYADSDPLTIPAELLDCLQDEPRAFEIFLSYTEGQQKEFIDWIDSAKTAPTKVHRIAETIERILMRKKFRDK